MRTVYELAKQKGHTKIEVIASNMYDEESADGLAAYQSSLNDLNMNSKPMINVLTMLAEENEANAKGIVTMIKTRIISRVSQSFELRVRQGQVGKFVLRAEDLRGALQNFGAQT